MEERGPDRPLADHLQVRVAQALEERHHLERDVVAMRISPETMWCADMPMRTGMTRDGSSTWRLSSRARS